MINSNKLEGMKAAILAFSTVNRICYQCTAVLFYYILK
jgi:hypothetical protein